MKKIKAFLFAFCALSFLFLMPVKAGSAYVEDTAGLLTQEEIQQLNEYAAEVSERYDCAVYVRYEQSFEPYNDIETFAESIFFGDDLGFSDEQNGALFVVTIAESSYDYMAHGTIGNGAFTDYAKDVLDDSVLPELSGGNWYGAAEAFIRQSDYYLGEYKAGTPYDDPTYIAEENTRKAANLGITFGVPPIISLLICLGLKSRNKTKHINTTAANYVIEDGVNLTLSRDIFLNRTQSRVLIKRNDDRSGSGSHGTTVNSSGSSHHSGKF